MAVPVFALGGEVWHGGHSTVKRDRQGQFSEAWRVLCRPALRLDRHKISGGGGSMFERYAAAGIDFSLDANLGSRCAEEDEA